MIDSTSLIQWLLNITPLLTLQLCAVLGLRKTISGYLGATATYHLWILPVIWTLLMWIYTSWSGLTSSQISPMSIELPVISSILDDNFVVYLDSEFLMPAQEKILFNGSSFWSAIFAIWLLGFLLISAIHITKLLRFHYYFRRAAVLSNSERTRELLTRLNFPRNIKLFKLDGISSPALYGISRPCLLIPLGFENRFNSCQQEAIYSHECVHLARNDNAINLLLLLLRIVFWFNPIFLLSYHCFRQDQEISCDSAVLCNSPKETKIQYAQALISCVSGKKYDDIGIGMTSWNSYLDLKRRTSMLNSDEAKILSRKSRIAVMSAIILFGTFACASVNGNGSNSSSKAYALLRAEIIPEVIYDSLSESNKQRISGSERHLEEIPADSEYIAFVIDTSGSMYNNPSWGVMIEKISITLDVYSDLKGIQVVNDMGDYLSYGSKGKWIPYTTESRDEILQSLRLWNPYSNSTPSEGIVEILSSLGKQGEKISIYVIGDDFQQNASIEEVIERVDLANSINRGEDKLARIHGIMLPTILTLQETGRFEGGADKYVSLMRALSEQSGGTFEILRSYREL